MVKFSRSALDKIATQLSQFDNPDIPEISLDDGSILYVNLLDNIMGPFCGPGNSKIRSIVTNDVRRIFSSIGFYRHAREEALGYAIGDRFSNIVPYFLSLTYFESCMASCWQICDRLSRMSTAQGGPQLYKKGDGTVLERLHDIYTYGSKHSYSNSNNKNCNELPTDIWLRNDGIECVSGAFLAYHELADIIL